MDVIGVLKLWVSLHRRKNDNKIKRLRASTSSIGIGRLLAKREVYLEIIVEIEKMEARHAD